MTGVHDLAPADELLAVCDECGRPLPAGRPRGLVHREGLWHRSFHCWIVRAGRRGAELILQRRARTKDTHPGAWDVSAAGHYRPGESVAGGLRELAEELGIVAPAEALVWLERHREIIRYPDGLRDREYQDVYLLRCDQPLDAYRPDPAEVDGVAALPAATLAALARGAVRHARTRGWLLGAAGWREDPVVLARGTLVPRSGRYYERVARAAARLLARSAPVGPWAARR
ncbi:MAG TPA: NUDIX domain-containing protein [Chloroflexota bacterium]|nr:NUDIX domain-containing protein [Chloroflexota bacterium]